MSVSMCVGMVLCVEIFTHGPAARADPLALGGAPSSNRKDLSVKALQPHTVELLVGQSGHTRVVQSQEPVRNSNYSHKLT